VAYSVELRFDQDLAERVRALWEKLGVIGAGSFGAGGKPVPHISLAVYDHEDEIDLAAAGGLIERLAARHAPIEIAFASFGVFPTEENVLFLAPVVTPALLDLHATYHDMAAALPATCRTFYLPGRWVPHCTLSMLGPMSAVLDGLRHLAADWAPLGGTIRSAALIRVPPLATLAEHALRHEADRT
jgi:2'-5' RNA ligase